MLIFLKKIAGPVAFWSGLWLLVSGIAELAQKGFVVHHINTRWIWLLFGFSALAWLISKNK